ncbi:activator of 90 kDa heat shock protein ATPase homolog 1-like [Argiope bruennichi]|uniref:Activator of 90 kDa heat shock protein ATPase like protein n=1 Tax=Argiope bruennichi TaxID=94029 RepID=A0A8T0FP28_ARGBR|nr:activator of 90 kDa heat shock protein ATPase homolog 1-like [Argiope bruennichi]KAF8790523.1 Activator of 90 kDa heat shock protein ATPase like protein [Argiope bruennichi]
MAKWGEGDPRWLVEERPDAKNVNNWHWTEKNASHWSKEKFREILVGTKIDTDFANCEITEISKCEGDAVVNNRKAKLIFFYEWGIEVKWSGQLVNSDTVVKGTLEIPNLSEEHDMKDVDVNVHLETTGPEADVVKDMMRKTGSEVIRRQLSLYVNSLKEEFSRGLILPTKDSIQPDEVKCDKSNMKRNIFENEVVNCSVKKAFETDTIHTTETFKCTADDFYRALTVKELVQAFTQGYCLLETKEGGRFELFDNNVHGYFVKLEQSRLIQQKWRFKTWPIGHYSEVTIEIKQKSDCTEVTVTQTGVPKTELDKTREGWKRFYWDSMKRVLGFGAPLF